MIIEEYNILIQILTEFRQEISNMENEIQNNLECIRDIEASLKAFTDAEPEDFKVFSPRNMENLHKEEIAVLRKEKSVHEERNRELENRKRIFEKYIPSLEEILKSSPEIPAENKVSAQELHDSSIRDLDDLVQKIEKSSTHIVMNPLQAKQDFAVIGSCLKQTVDKMRNTVWIV